MKILNKTFITASSARREAAQDGWIVDFVSLRQATKNDVTIELVVADGNNIKWGIKEGDNDGPIQ